MGNSIAGNRVSPAAINAVAKAINIGSGLFSKKKKKNGPSGGTVGVAQPGAKSMVQQSGAAVISSPGPYRFLFATIQEGFSFEAMLCPWQTYSHGSVSWDPQLTMDLETKREYRVLSCELEFLGSGPTTSTVSVYMAGARDPNTDFPESNEYSLVERYYIGPIYEPGRRLVLPHDTEWHEINTLVTSASPATDKKVFCAGIFFIGLDGTSTLHGKFQLTMKLQFRGRDPVVSLDPLLTDSTTLAPAHAYLCTNNQLSRRLRVSIGVPAAWVYNSARPIGTATGIQTDSLTPGYWLVIFDATSFLGGAAGDLTDNFIVENPPGNDVSASRRLLTYNIGNAGGGGGGTESVLSTWAFLHVQTGDRVSVGINAPNVAAARWLARLQTIRLSVGTAQSYYNQEGGVGPLPF